MAHLFGQEGFQQSLEASGPPLRVDAALQITTTHVSTRLARTIERAAGNIRRQAKLGCLKCCAEPLPDGTCCCVPEGSGCPKTLPPSCGQEGAPTLESAPASTVRPTPSQSAAGEASTTCVDKAIPSDWMLTTCTAQQSAGKCSEWWNQPPDGYCLKTCGVC